MQTVTLVCMPLSAETIAARCARTDGQIILDQIKAWPSGEKFCKRCGRDKPLSDFGSVRKAFDGLTTECRECLSARTADRALRRAVQNRLNPPLEEGSKPCSVCCEVKPLAEFNRRASATDGKSSQCKTCLRWPLTTPNSLAMLACRFRPESRTARRWR